MENTLLFEDLEYSVTSSPGGYNHFIENFNRQNHCDIDKLIKEGIMIKVEEEPINENRGFHYFGRNRFNTIKIELEKYLTIIDLNKIQQNPYFENEIRLFANVQRERIVDLIDKYFNPEYVHGEGVISQHRRDPKRQDDILPKNYNEYDDISRLFDGVLKGIFNQPLFVLEAIKKYSDEPNQQQRIYYQHKFIKGQIRNIQDRFNNWNLVFKDLFDRNLFNRNKDLKDIFLFLDELIEESKEQIRLLEIDYLNTPFSRHFISKMIWYKERCDLRISDTNLSNIQRVITMYHENENQPPQKEPDTPTKPTLTGFQSSLTDPQIENLYSKMQGNYFEATPDHFKAIFKSKLLPPDFVPITRLKPFTSVLCAYFIYELFQRENPGDYWSIAENCFNAKNLRQSFNNAVQLNPMQKPKGYKDIDTILQNIYTPLL